VDLLRVHMAQRKAQREAMPPEYARWGGRGLTAAMLTQEVPPACDPLGPFNKLVFAPGLLAGRGVSSAGRISIGAKSPLTGGIKESNAGGNAAWNLVKLGLGAIVVDEQAEAGQLFILQISPESCQLLPADELQGLGVYALAKALQKRFGRKNALILVGQGGEMRLLAAGIALTDRDGTPGRLAARGGLGAVLGSKGLKAIVIEDARGEASPPSDPAALKEAIRRYVANLREDYYTSEVFPEVGTPYMVAPMQKLGGLPTRNFSAGNFEDLSELEGNAVRNTILQRGGAGKTTHACMTGCVVRCSNVIPDENGHPLVAPIEYESMIMLGPNLGIASLDAVAAFNRRCNDLGIDTVDVGGAIGVAMQAGVLEFGDIEGVFHLLDQIEHGTELGKMIGSGAATTGHTLGVTRTPVVKGQCIAAYDPRAIKGLGVTYATSPMGADHTAGHTADFPVNHRSPAGQVELSRQVQITAAAWDTLGLCSFVTGAIAPTMHLLVEMLRAIDGSDYPEDYISRLGQDVLKMERAFNQSAGFTSADDRLPDYFKKEELPPFNVVFDVNDEDLDRIFKFTPGDPEP
jgi:aldehyde:ferredoxin oxidoreductase